MDTAPLHDYVQLGQPEIYAELYDAVLATMFRHDPLGLNYEDNANEYAHEANAVLPRLRGAGTSDDVLHILFEEFVRSVGGGLAGDKSRYTALARDIWDLWQRRECGDSAS